MYSQPTISLVVRTYNSAGYVGRTLAAAHKQSLRADELVVVDSGSIDDTLAVAEQYDARVVSLRHEDFRPGYALNLGCSASECELLVLLSSDAMPASRDWLAELVAPLSDPTVAATYGKQLPYRGCDPISLRDLATGYGDTPRLQTTDPWFSAANAALRRALWESSPFREDLNGAEDQEWVGRVQAQGHAIAYVPTAPVYHSHVETLRQVYVRFYKQAADLRAFRPGARTSLQSFLRDWLARTREDWRYLYENGAELPWYGWLPAYRFARSLGLHRGTWHRPSSSL